MTILIHHAKPSKKYALLNNGDPILSSDGFPKKVKAFFKKAELPYCDKFVSITAYKDEIPTYSTAKGYSIDKDLNTYALLCGTDFLKLSAVLDLETVLKDISIICSNDIQNQAITALEVPSRFEEIKNTFHLPLPDDKAKLKQIENLFKNSISGNYIEIRLYRSLKKIDIKCWQ